MFYQLAAAAGFMLAGVLGCAAYFWGTSLVLDLIFPSKGKSGVVASRNLRITNAIRPWLFLAPALFALATYLIYPVIMSLWYSFHDRAGQNFVGVSNYAWMVNDGEFRQSIYNNFLWLLVVPALSTFFGLVIAALTDRIWWGNIAKTLIFMPMAISFVGAAVIWKFIYDFRPEGAEQIGLLNAIVVAFGGAPQAWITLPFWNNFFLMAILVWIQTGFAMVILSAALRGIPEETIEAAVIDGANGWQIFFKIMVPQIWGTIAVVWTTITILVLKVFDIVLAMTNGQWQSQVLANLMFDWMFRGGGDFGRGAAIAVVIMILVIPIMVWNIRNAAKEMKGH
ncbi:sugar ABC transporter permease [Ensifer sp. ENS07]|jgi:alpha-glucoside transport system permease protein|uniref:Sugar ABC transporter permease n=1 Tax=Ensifer adhaerens TaxID=106592 RepID=A0A9Q8Y9N3_ENSAD|nr:MULTISPECIES: sugar ABC transporter permease [Ensifer]KSV67746.1 alpha-glucoside ABC transporter permease [Sinorhizobium sp. GL2]KQX60058.1 alpha-glucoside ABC transporter permease [Ensifer sp. Root1298]KQX93619.1 alpha-glucoside ABC transporter permease [Ensifer sp. Root1312]KRC14370.1 alpha-glucoside ABC transporter permease [Ensifer sp. Root74]KRD68240.1 alpha-glucoside ABC transporter permease [Ensifer sp. Root954]